MLAAYFLIILSGTDVEAVPMQGYGFCESAQRQLAVENVRSICIQAGS